MTQLQKRSNIKAFESKILSEKDYQNFLDIIKKEDEKLNDISKTFSDITLETKRILDTIRDKSNDRRRKYGIKDGDEFDVHQNVDHHRDLPYDVTSQLLKSAKEVSIVFRDLFSLEPLCLHSKYQFLQNSCATLLITFI